MLSLTMSVKLKSQLKVCCLYEADCEYIVRVQDGQITEVDRATIIKWMIYVGNHVNQNSEISLVAAAIFDRFLSNAKIPDLQPKLKVIAGACLLIASKARSIEPYTPDILLEYGLNMRNSPSSYSTIDLCSWEENIRRTHRDVNGVFAIDLARSLLNNITLPRAIKLAIIKEVKQEMIHVSLNYVYLSSCVKVLTMCCLENAYHFHTVDFDEGDEETFKEEKFDNFTKPIARLLNINIKFNQEYNLLYHDILKKKKIELN